MNQQKHESYHSYSNERYAEKAPRKKCNDGSKKKRKKKSSLVGEKVMLNLHSNHSEVCNSNKISTLSSLSNHSRESTVTSSTFASASSNSSSASSRKNHSTSERDRHKWGRHHQKKAKAVTFEVVKEEQGDEDDRIIERNRQKNKVSNKNERLEVEFQGSTTCLQRPCTFYLCLAVGLVALLLSALLIVSHFLQDSEDDSRGPLGTISSTISSEINDIVEKTKSAVEDNGVRKLFLRGHYNHL